MMASTNIPEVLTAFDTVMSQASNSKAACTESPLNVDETLIGEENNRTSHVADAILDQELPEELASRSTSMLNTQGPARSDQGAQGTTSAESGPQVENQTSRSASLVNHSEDVREGGAQPPNILYNGLTVNTSMSMSRPNNPMRQRPQVCLPSFNDIYNHELEKLSREQGELQKNFEDTTLELKAELERKMAEVRSEYDRKLQEVDAAFNVQAEKEEANRRLVVMNSLLGKTFKSEYLDRSSGYPGKIAATVAAVRARSSQHSMQQQQEVQTNTHMNSTVPRPSATAATAPVPILSGPLVRIPCFHMTLPRVISQQEAVQSKTDMSPTATPRPSVTSQQTTSLHLPLCNTRQPGPPPLISNHMPSSYSAASSPPVHGVVRTMAPHLRSSRTLNPAGASTTHPTSLVQEQQQQPQQRMTTEQTPQQENLNSGFVYISDDD